MEGKEEGKRRGKDREGLGEKRREDGDGKGKKGKGEKRGACTHLDFRKSAPMPPTDNHCHIQTA